MNRRGFLGSILVACAAPAIVRADSLMRIMPTERFIIPGAASWRGMVREVSQYDLVRDRMLYRWDVAGYVNGILSQLHVTIGHDYLPIPALVTNVQRPEAIICAAAEPAPGLDSLRESALEVLRGRVNSEGMLVATGVLQLPPGMAHARFLG